MIPTIKDIERQTKTEKYEAIPAIRAQYSIQELCEHWGISIGTYYNLMRKWGIDLSDVRRRKRRIQIGNQSLEDYETPYTHLIVSLREELDRESLLQFLQAIQERIVTSCGPFHVRMVISITKQIKNEFGLLPIPIFKGLSMEDKIRYLARWVMTDQDKDLLLNSWGLDTGCFLELMGDLKVPMNCVLEEKQFLQSEAARMLQQRPDSGVGLDMSDDGENRLYELSGAYTHSLLQVNMGFVSRLIKQRSHTSYWVDFRIEEIMKEGG